MFCVLVCDLRHELISVSCVSIAGTWCGVGVDAASARVFTFFFFLDSTAKPRDRDEPCRAQAARDARPLLAGAYVVYVGPTVDLHPPRSLHSHELTVARLLARSLLCDSLASG